MGPDMDRGMGQAPVPARAQEQDQGAGPAVLQAGMAGAPRRRAAARTHTGPRGRGRADTEDKADMEGKAGRAQSPAGLIPSLLRDRGNKAAPAAEAAVVGRADCSWRSP
jgi:hypothetical protein